MPESFLIVVGPAFVVLLLKKNVILASAVFFISLLLVNWWLHVPGILVFYGIALPIIVAITHYFRVRNVEKPIGMGSA
jgi:phosphate starvation-inducible membrane PsiE